MKFVYCLIIYCDSKQTLAYNLQYVVTNHKLIVHQFKREEDFRIDSKIVCEGAHPLGHFEPAKVNLKLAYNVPRSDGRTHCGQHL